MQDCINRHIVGKMPAGKVLDIGSRAPTTSELAYRKLFEAASWTYYGLDLEEGHNVDFVATDPFQFPIGSNEFDAVISGQMLEHNGMFWLTFLEMARVLRPGGLMIHVVPSRGFEHRAPTDCWRMYRDSMHALATWSGLVCLEATTDWSAADLEYLKAKRPAVYQMIPNKDRFSKGGWGDTVGVLQKPDDWHPTVAMRYMTHFVDLFPKSPNRL